MSLYKRKGSPFWWTRFTVSGRSIRQSTGTEEKGLAEQYEARLKTQLYKELELGAKPKRAWEDAAVRWLQEQSEKKSLDSDKGHLRWLSPHLRRMTLDQIDRAMIDRLVQAKLDSGVSKATVNRMQALLRALLRRAWQEWEWIDKVPAFRLFKEPKGRVRWITQAEAARLLAELPEHQQAAMLFELETGLRASNVCSLRWSQIDMQRQCAWVHADQAKGDEAIAVPLSELARDVLRKQIGKHTEFVFTYRGKPVTRFSTRAWTKAKARAGIENFKWHDLRHTWASWHRQTGTPLDVLQELGAWKSFAMVQRYAHLSSDHLLEHAEKRNAEIALQHKNGTERK